LLVEVSQGHSSRLADLRKTSQDLFKTSERFWTKTKV
jgi:hypothetical protein